MEDTGLKERVLTHEREIRNHSYRIKDLENMMMRVLWVQQETQMQIARLSKEMKDFKDEMKDFKDEMLEFKKGVEEFKNEMKDFKDEMLEFKNEMKEFKDEVNRDRIRINKQWGELARKMGTVVEDVVAPGFPHAIYKYFNIEIEDLIIRRKKKNKGITREYDIIGLGGNYLFVVDVKNTYRFEYFEGFRQLLEDFFDFFPEFQGKTIVPVIASFSLNRDIINSATTRNILALQLGGEYLEFVNIGEVNI